MPPLEPPRADAIRIRGARQNNLKNLNLDLPLNELIVVTGVSGSGKSSLVFDTLYAEGQRRYVETFSPYARQFLDRMDKPLVDRIEGIPPSIAIDQTNPVRTSRSTVGTMTELNDHLKLLFARAAIPYCRSCAKPVRRDTPASIVAALAERARNAGDPKGGPPRLLITFPVVVPNNFSEDEIKTLLAAQGYTRIHAQEGSLLHVIQDRFRWADSDPGRVGDAVEAALKAGHGRLDVYVQSELGEITPPWRFSTDLHCADCDIAYKDPNPSTFSFNSPLGACDTCRGFGRIIGVDYELVIPDHSLTLRGGAIKPWQTQSYEECQADLLKFARKRSIPLDTPWRELTEAQRRWVLDGEGEWTKNVWYGVRRFFAWLETKAYKMHIRVLLSRYRSYTECPACHGARLKPDALLWRIGEPGYNIRELMLLPVDECRRFFATLSLPAPLDAADLLLREIRARLKYLSDVGLGYLNLDRQSRTLSGGEVQRINLTTALGTSLVSTLFVLDEPSIGLHPRDVGRIVGVMQRLRDAGNTLVVVEHDPTVMQAADRVLDIGPGPGEHGGEIVFYGPLKDLARAERSLTADYLFRRKRVEIPPARPAGPSPGRADSTAVLRLEGAAEHNLKNIDVDIPLHRLVCVTGVSGSGKSTLIHDVLFPALLRAKGRPTDNPGRHRALTGAGFIGDVVMVDQTRIGRTTRSNPASYVGAFDAIRNLFAKLPQALERHYTAGTFSFNAGNGRCPACGGNGFEHVEMQFLSDVYLRCPDCDGRRFRAEILECTLSREGFAPKSIADVLDLTVSEALAFFRDDAEVCLRLAPLADVGLDYLRLGQPVPTLSGGEAQRLKLAGHLAENAALSNKRDRAGRRPAAAGTTGSLFLFDEPTTGLHFDDVAKLLRAFRRLIDAGHSLLVIEHNLDVVRAADWIIDLGPEGGEAGGSIVCAGPPAEIMRTAGSHTGRALIDAAGNAAFVDAVRDSAGPAHPVAAPASIEIRGAREHNLKNIDVDLGRNRFTVITGVSGSGKSSLAFDILFAEGQRRYLESLNAYARQFVQPASRPDVDAIFGIPPTVAIEQRTSRGGHKSTVATLTEIYHFLRLMYVKLGVQHCPVCDAAIEPQSADAIAAHVLGEYRGRTIDIRAPLIVARKGLYTALAKWARGKGYRELRVDGSLIPTAKWPRLDRFIEHDIELPVATVTVNAANEPELRAALDTALEHGRGVLHVAAATAAGTPARAKSPAADAPRTVFSTKRACPSCGTGFPELDPRLFSFNSRHGWCKTCFGTGLQIADFDAEQSGEESRWHDSEESRGGDSAGDDPRGGHQRGAGALRGDPSDGGPAHDGTVSSICPDCAGERLNPVARHVLFRGLSIAALTSLPVQEFAATLKKIKLHGRERDIARDLLAELGSRTAFLCDVGLGYLQMNRAAPTLSGGEAQRIRLAAQLGSNLQGVCYVLDEPTIGLHPRDNIALLDTLDRLRAKGNTLVVVEHDEETIRRADHVIDLGPGAGTRGGRLVAEGTAAELALLPDSPTGRCLASPYRHSRSHRPVVRGTPSITVRGATLHNLKKVDARIPLGRLTVVTGVSGSGKSSLARDVLLGNLRRLLAPPSRATSARSRERRSDRIPSVAGCESLTGWETVSRVLEVDQTPIGRTPRSCPATYVGFWDSIRRLYAETTDARIRGFTAGRFSFNTAGGRCESCDGVGLQRIEMSFLPDVLVPCDVCGGRRFNQETLSILFKGRSIGETLASSVEDAVEFFAAQRSVQHPLSLLAEVGLGYLSLGQPSPTLSGGESQRIKLVAELAKVRTDALGVDIARRDRQHTLYVLDEPTVGLHMADVEKLVKVLQRLVDAGNSVVVIEHNLDIMAEADWIIDLGPEGGAGGGRIVAQGMPEAVTRRAGKSHTARILGEFLTERGSA